MENVNIKINGMPLSVPKDATVLEACRLAGIQVPTLCYLKEINEIGACRICVVEVKGARTLVASCSVSYTHLDVYKRQQVGRLAAALEHPPDGPVGVDKAGKGAVVGPVGGGVLGEDRL